MAFYLPAVPITRFSQLIDQSFTLINRMTALYFYQLTTLKTIIFR
ncbi:MAG: hypothetical protein FWJ66_08850 [Caldibacillus sp.]